MVSDKPPRRPRSGKTPVTIDMAADPSKVIAEPVRSDDSDALPPAPQPADEPISKSSRDAAPASMGAFGTMTSKTEEADKIADAPAQSAPADGDIPASVPKPDTAPAKPSVVETGTAQARGPAESPKPEPQKPEPKAPSNTDPVDAKSPFRGAQSTGAATASAPPVDRKPTVPATSTRKAPSGATLAAAGIIGGLVALLLAGSMQYAGYLPGSARSTGGDVLAEIADLKQQIAALRAAPPAAADGDLPARVEALESSIGNTGASGEVTERLASLQSEIEALRSSTQSDNAAATDLAQRLSGIETRLDRPGPEQAVARALAAAALKAATERGGSFASELTTFAGVASDDPAVEGLRAYAEKGVPTQAELVRRLPGATDAILNAAHQPAEGEGVAGRLLASAMRVVKVRPVGNVEGETPEAIVARMEDQVKNSNLKAAVSEWNTLPDAAKQASQDFKQALDARIDVDDLASGTLTRAMTSTGTAG